MSAKPYKRMSYSDWLYDLFVGCLSLADMITNVLVSWQFFIQSRMLCFYVALAIYLIAQCVYGVMFVHNFLGRKPIYTKVVYFVLFLPFGPIVSYLLYLDHIGIAEGLLQMLHLTSVTGLYDNRYNNDPINQWLRFKFEGHLGFLVEALVSSFPQSILQMIAVVYYGECTALNIISVTFSLLSVCSKGIVFSYSIDNLTFMCHWLLIVVDFWGIFTILAWVFYIPPNVTFNYLFHHSADDTDTYPIFFVILSLVWFLKVVFITFPIAVWVTNFFLISNFGTKISWLRNAIGRKLHSLQSYEYPLLYWLLCNAVFVVTMIVYLATLCAIIVISTLFAEILHFSFIVGGGGQDYNMQLRSKWDLLRPLLQWINASNQSILSQFAVGMTHQRQYYWWGCALSPFALNGTSVWNFDYYLRLIIANYQMSRHLCNTPVTVPRSVADKIYATLHPWFDVGIPHYPPMGEYHNTRAYLQVLSGENRRLLNVSTDSTTDDVRNEVRIEERVITPSPLIDEYFNSNRTPPICKMVAQTACSLKRHHLELLNEHISQSASHTLWGVFNVAKNSWNQFYDSLFMDCFGRIDATNTQRFKGNHTLTVALNWYLRLGVFILIPLHVCSSILSIVYPIIAMVAWLNSSVANDNLCLFRLILTIVYCVLLCLVVCCLPHCYWFYFTTWKLPLLRANDRFHSNWKRILNDSITTHYSVYSTIVRNRMISQKFGQLDTLVLSYLPRLHRLDCQPTQTVTPDTEAMRYRLWVDDGSGDSGDTDSDSDAIDLEAARPNLPQLTQLRSMNRYITELNVKQLITQCRS